MLEGQDFKRTVDNSTLNVYGGQGYGHGAFLQLTGTGDAGAGEFNIQAHDGVNSKVLKGKADGSFTWNGVAISLSNHTHSNYAASSHTHTKSQITDFPTIPSNTSQLTNDSGYITSSGSCNYANSSGNADTVDGSHAWQMQTLSSTGVTHGSNEWLMQCQYNVDGDGYFKLYCGDKSIGTKVDRATNAGYADSTGSCSSSTYSTYLNSLGAQTPKSGRDIFHPGVYTYTTYTDTNTPAHYGAVIGYGNGQGGSCEMFAEWVGSGQLWFRVLRDWQDSWTSWEKINTESNTVLNGYRIYVG